MPRVQRAVSLRLPARRLHWFSSTRQWHLRPQLLLCRFPPTGRCCCPSAGGLRCHSPLRCRRGSLFGRGSRWRLWLGAPQRGGQLRRCRWKRLSQPAISRSPPSGTAAERLRASRLRWLLPSPSGNTHTPARLPRLSRPSASTQARTHGAGSLWWGRRWCLFRLW